MVSVAAAASGGGSEPLLEALQGDIATIAPRPAVNIDAGVAPGRCDTCMNVDCRTLLDTITAAICCRRTSCARVSSMGLDTGNWHPQLRRRCEWDCY
jgi:hypothetical protein